MRHHGGDEAHEDGEAFARCLAQARVARQRVRREGRGQRVDQLVEARDALVESEALDIVADTRRRAMGRAAHQLGGVARLARGGVRLGARCSAVSATRRQTRCTKRCAPSAPASVQITSRSGGESESMNQRAVSAPSEAMMSSGSTTFFLDFDIFSIEPISISAPVDRRLARRWPSTSSIKRRRAAPIPEPHLPWRDRSRGPPCPA